MYLKLGTINLQYYQNTNDWMIMAEVIDSSMSFEEPILVRTTDELDIWFGRYFTDYDYLYELVRMGIVLYLYKPVSKETTGSSDWIDLSRYVENPNVWLTESEIDWVEKVLADPARYKFKFHDEIGEPIDVRFVIEGGLIRSLTTQISGQVYATPGRVRDGVLEDIADIYNTNPGFHVYDSKNLWIWWEGEIINTALLPQNINQTSISTDNRDTLVIGRPGETIPYTYLEYRTGSDELGVWKDKELVEKAPAVQILEGIDMDSIVEEQQSLAFRVPKRLERGDYILIPASLHPQDWILYFTISYPVSWKGRSEKVTDLRLEPLFQRQGYTVIEEEDGLVVIAPKIIPALHFSTVPFDPIPEITEKILASYMAPGFEVVSKTIGKSSLFDDDLIKMEIEQSETNDRFYRVTISRYSYSEVFEGPVKNKPGEEERLDSIITKNSKLVRAEYKGGDGLPLGTFYLRGATIEDSPDPEMYNYSIEKMMSKDGVFPDYFLIPNKYLFGKTLDPDLTYLPVYDKFLEFSKTKECQFLIENNTLTDLYTVVETESFPDKPAEGTYYKIGNQYYDDHGTLVEDELFLTIAVNNGDYVLNKVNDPENRLIYFYRSMTSIQHKRPGYYTYLRGLLTNEFAASVNDIIYPDVTNDPYEEDELEKTLETWKSNYMVCNNQVYYYKRYFNGKNYTNTGWMRFVAGKIHREIEKNQGNFMGQQLLGKVRSGIIDLLYSIQSSFSIVSSIELVEFEPDAEHNAINLTIDTYVNDLVGNNVRLDITVNYNNSN